MSTSTSRYARCVLLHHPNPPSYLNLSRNFTIALPTGRFVFVSFLAEDAHLFRAALSAVIFYKRITVCCKIISLSVRGIFRNEVNPNIRAIDCSHMRILPSQAPGKVSKAGKCPLYDHGQVWVPDTPSLHHAIDSKGNAMRAMPREYVCKREAMAYPNGSLQVLPSIP